MAGYICWCCYNFHFFIIGLFFLSTSIYAAPNNTCGVNAALKPLTSDPAYQSPTSSLLLASSIDPTAEYLCSAGSGYDLTGITCYALKCPAPNPYGNSYDQRTPYASPYGGRPQGPGYQQQKGAPYGQQSAISVGAQVASVETAYPCWKLRQLRLNTYVYIVCFVRGYPTIVYQVTFKDNFQVELVQIEQVPNNGVSAVARVTFTTEQQFSCMAAVFSTYHGSFHSDFLREPNDLVAPIYHICPNNYKWYFCGNIPIVSTVDVSMLSVGKNLELFFVTRQAIDAPVVSGSIIHVDPTAPSTNTSIPKGTSAIVHFSVFADIDLYVCTSRLVETVTEIGCATAADSEDPFLYPLCGIQKCNIISVANVTALCCAVDILQCRNQTHITGAPDYSSFCIVYDQNSNRLDPDRVVFLEGATQATDIQYVRGNGESCQFLVVNSATKPLAFYCLSSLVSAINNMTGACTAFPPVAIPHTTVGYDSIFNSAISCSFKSKCCGQPQTCVTCTRPAKFGDKYLAELSCGHHHNTVIPNEDSYGGAQQPVRAPYGVAAPVVYGRPVNYSSPVIQPQYGPQPPQVYQQAGPYMVPPGPYPPQQPQQPPPVPMYGGAPVRYN